jgi:hypothetical protein
LLSLSFYMSRLVTGLAELFPVLLVAVACGGVVEGGSRDPVEETPDSSPSSPGANSSPSAANPDADTDLGECTLGPLENRATAQLCAWVAEQRCYETREMACNCACPRTRNSRCSSGFDGGPDGHVWVACH